MNEIRTKKVEVVPYDSQWPIQFQTVYELVEPILSPWLIAIEHVGSTSVVGLAAKPIIDVDCVVRRIDFDMAIRALEDHGFSNRGDLGIPDRYAIAGPSLPFKYHLYLTFPDANSFREHVALRDWLRTHDEDRNRYAALKEELAAKHTYDIDSYIDGKSALIHEILLKTGIRKS